MLRHRHWWSVPVHRCHLKQRHTSQVRYFNSQSTAQKQWRPTQAAVPLAPGWPGFPGIPKTWCESVETAFKVSLRKLIMFYNKSCTKSTVVPGGPWRPGVPKEGKWYQHMWLCYLLIMLKVLSVQQPYLEVQYPQEVQLDLWVQGVLVHLGTKNCNRIYDFYVFILIKRAW